MDSITQIFRLLITYGWVDETIYYFIAIILYDNCNQQTDTALRSLFDKIIVKESIVALKSLLPLNIIFPWSF